MKSLSQLISSKPFKVACVLTTLLLAGAPQAGTSSQIQLSGPLTQGGMVVGKTAPNAEVYLDGKALKVSQNGDFVFGFGRDDKLKHELKVINGQHTETMPIVISKRDYKIEKIDGIENKYVSPPKDVIDRIVADNQKVGKARAVETDRTDFLSDIKMPVKGRISGVYGSQRVLNGKPKRPHFGLDIAAPTGTKVKAPLKGKVVLVHNDMYYTGGTLIIEHGHGITSTFIHLSKILVKEGDSIEQGDDIAEVGATGRVTGPHLDWRMNWYKVRLDPQLLVSDK